MATASQFMRTGCRAHHHAKRSRLGASVPGIETAARAFMPGTMILDGEAVVLNEQGIPDFGRL